LGEILDFELLYKHLEEKVIDYKYRQIAELFQKIRDKMHIEQKTDLETKAQWEMDIFNFSIEENVVKPLWTMPDEEGEMVSYPNYDNFVPATYEYIIERLDSTANPFLKARYAHILWFSPQKHGKYAEMAIDAYLQLIKLFEQKDKENPQKHFGLDALSAVKNAFFLSRNINDTRMIDLAKSEVKRLIFGFNSRSGSLLRLRIDLIDLMLNEKTVFSKDDFSGINDLYFNFAKGLGNSHKSISIFGLGEKIDQKLGTTSYNWKELIGGTYEEMMRTNMGKNKLVAIAFCQDALKYYRQLNDSKKIDELEKIYIELKNSIELKEFKTKIDLGEYIKDCERRAKAIAQHSPEEILIFLMSEKNLVPKYDEMKRCAEELLKEHALQSVFPIQLFDERGHNAQHFTSQDEILYYHTLQQYRMYLENQCLPMINLTIIEAIKEKKITFAELIDFLKKYTWFGKTITKKIQNQEIGFNWLNLLAPSLFEYFEQMNYFLAVGKCNLILCIDSLILKIEGLLRDLCNYSGIATFFQTQDKQGRIIYQEKDLNRLLHEEKVKELFDEDDLLLFKFVLVEKAGYNLRHEIAHSLVFYGEYNIAYVHLLLLLLLKLGKFDFKQIEKQSANIT